jgi:hypothetical protein
MKLTLVTDGTGQPITAAGPVPATTGLDISGLSGPYNIAIAITNFTTTSGPGHCRIVAEDTVNAFTAALPICEWTFQCTGGPQGGMTTQVVETFSQATAPGLRIGTASAKLRFNVIEIDGTGASLSLTGELQN